MLIKTDIVHVYSYSLDFYHRNTYSISNTHTNALKNIQTISLACLGLKTEISQFR